MSLDALGEGYRITYELFKTRIDKEMETYLEADTPNFDKAITHLLTQEELLKKEEPIDDELKELRALELRYITIQEKKILKTLSELFGVKQNKRITVKLDTGLLKPLLDDIKRTTSDLEYRVKDLEKRPLVCNHSSVAKGLNTPSADTSVGGNMPDDVMTEDENISYFEPEDQPENDLEGTIEDQPENDTPQQPMTTEEMLARLNSVYNEKHREIRQHSVKGVGLDITAIAYALGVPITIGVKKDPFIIGEYLGHKKIFDAYIDDEDFKLKFMRSAKYLAEGDTGHAMASLVDTLGDEEYTNILIEKIQNDPVKRQTAIEILSKFNPNGEDVFTRNIENGDPKALEKILGAMGVYSLATGTRYNLEKMFKDLA